MKVSKKTKSVDKMYKYPAEYEKNLPETIEDSTIQNSGRYENKPSKNKRGSKISMQKL